MNKREMFAWGIAGLSCVCAIGSYISHKRTARLLKKSVEELAKATPVEIEKDVVDAVVQRGSSQNLAEMWKLRSVTME